MRIGYAQQRNTESFKLFDLLLVVGLTLSPMTAFRVWKVGPAEVLCLLWGIRYLFKRRFRKNDTISFFVPFLIILTLGFIYCSFIARNEASVNGLLTWLYLALIAISLYEGLSQKSLSYTEKLLRIFSTTAILWYFFLFLYSRTISPRFLGAPLWYASKRFSGGGTNPHQVAVMLCGLCFVFAREVMNRRRVYLNILFAGISIYLLYQTASSTGVMAIFLGFLICVYFLLVNIFPKSRAPVAVILTLILALIGIFVYRLLYSRFMSWVASDDNGLGRLNIFAEFPASFARSPIIGLGPGTHGRGGVIEFHNTYLEIAAASGVLGFFVFLVYTVRIFKKILRGDWKLFPAVCAMYTYGLAGFAMRRLIYWGILMFVVVIAEKKLQIQQQGDEG